MDEIAGKSTDPLAEIESMRNIAAELSRLDVNAAKRVLKWAAERFLGSSGGTLAHGNYSTAQTGSMAPEMSGDSGLAIGEFFATAHVANQAEAALVMGYWMQVHEGQSDFEAQRVNAELKNLGHGIGNITMAFNELMRQRPQLVIQTRKTGSAKQSRKKYRLTMEGVRRVQQMVNGAANDDGTDR